MPQLLPPLRKAASAIVANAGASDPTSNGGITDHSPDHLPSSLHSSSKDENKDEPHNDVQAIGPSSSLFLALESIEKHVRHDIAALRRDAMESLHEISSLLTEHTDNMDSHRTAQSQWTSTADAELHTSGNSEPIRSRISFAGISHNDSSNKLERSASNMGATPTVQVMGPAVTFASHKTTRSGNAPQAQEMTLRRSTLNARLQSLETLVKTQSSMNGHARGNWSGWPMDLAIREELLEAQGPHGNHLGTLKRLADVHRYAAGVVSHSPTSFKEEPIVRVVRPDSRRRFSFDILSLVVLSFQIWYTPFALTWPKDFQSVDLVVLALTALFWMMDLGLNFITGFYTTDGEVELSPATVARHYLKTWFLLDFLCVLADVVNLIREMVMDWSNLSNSENRVTFVVLRVLKMQRFLRVLLLVRMLRFTRMLNAFMEARVSATWRLTVRTFQISALLVWVTHVAACTWWAIGLWGPTGVTGDRWVDSWEVGPEEQREPMISSGWVYQYFTSYHWALAQITLGAHEIAPVNTCERVVAIFCNLFGLIFGSSLVSILSMTTLQYREVDKERYTKMHVLHEFLTQHDVEVATRLKITRQVQERVKPRDRTLTEQDVPALLVLSQSLLKELRYQLFSRHLRKHALFQVWEQLHGDSLRKLCGEGCRFTVLPPEDELFAFGHTSQAGYMVVDGKLSYQQDSSDGLVEEDTHIMVTNGEWLSDATWWCHWVHVGTACSTSATTLVHVPPEVVLTTMAREASVNSVSVAYGLRLHARMTEPENIITTDVVPKSVSFRDMVCVLPRDVHILLGVAALQHLAQKRETQKQIRRLDKLGYLRALEEEALEGQSLILLDDDGNLHRRVALVVLELVNDNDEVLVELAHHDNEEGSAWKTSLRLPAEKQMHEETTMDTLKRLLECRMSALTSVLLEGVAPDLRYDEEFHNSEKFGLGTIYLKTYATYKADDEVNNVIAGRVEHVGYRSYRSDANRMGSLPAQSQTLGSVPSIGARRLLQERFRTLDRAYLLQGSTHRGIYAWMTLEEYEAIQKHSAVDGIHAIVGKIASAMDMALCKFERLSSGGTTSNSSATSATSEAEPADNI